MTHGDAVVLLIEVGVIAGLKLLRALGIIPR